ncbi:hypothetical protein KA517_00375 [Candidatus Gracilibacteria bacterium]|nr:hypothetical protein [Candidatus Gracilibacteria bacterium]MBP7057704.1 hypothetical protein [Candidatus Gracilibacteria bacterium]
MPFLDRSRSRQRESVAISGRVQIPSSEWVLTLADVRGALGRGIWHTKSGVWQKICDQGEISRALYRRAVTPLRILLHELYLNGEIERRPNTTSTRFDESLLGNAPDVNISELLYRRL